MRMRNLVVLASAILIIVCWKLARSQSASKVGGFEDLDVTITAHQGADTPTFVLVELEYPLQLLRTPRCFVAPDSLRVTVDGHALQRVAPGGEPRPSRPTMISGVEIPDLGCTPARFRTPAGTQLDIKPKSVIVIEDGQKRAEIIVASLLSKRTVKVLPSRARPGDRVTLHWTDGSRWEGSDLSTAVVVYEPNEFSVRIPREELVVEPPRFSFIVPGVRPGHAYVELEGELRQRARILACRGVKSCNARPNTFHDRLELTIER